jgi:hypothetical protein
VFSAVILARPTFTSFEGGALPVVDEKALSLGGEEHLLRVFADERVKALNSNAPPFFLSLRAGSTTERCASLAPATRVTWRSESTLASGMSSE